MFKSIIKFTLLCYSITALPLVAQQNQGSVNTNDKVIILHQKSDNKRPNAPSRYYLECHLNNNSLIFTLPPFITYMTITIHDNESSAWDSFITSENPRVELPLDLTGMYNIICTTDENQVFVGTIHFN